MEDVSLRKKKGKKKNLRKTASVGGAGGSLGDDDDDVTSMNGYGSDDDRDSVASYASTVDTTFDDEGKSGDEGVDVLVDFQSALLDNIEGARQKSAKSRQICLEAVKKEFSRRYLNEFVSSRKDTLLDLLEKLLKRGTSEDRVVSAEICSCLIFQLDVGDGQAIFTAIKPSLLNIIADETAAVAQRAAACSALGVCCFVGSVEQTDTADCLKALKLVFCKKVAAAASAHSVQAAAVGAWALLLSVSPQALVTEQIEDCVPVMCRLLESGDLTLRVMAGESVALISELSREFRIAFNHPTSTMCELLRELANESGKHKGKREKRQQKASFRDILKSVEAGLSPDDNIQFGSESLSLDSWQRMRQYSALKHVLGSGTLLHLQSNPLVRDIFELGLPMATTPMKESRDMKYERQLNNQAVAKDRSQRRSKRRDCKQATYAS